MQARCTRHIIDQLTDTTLCGLAPAYGRWYGNARPLTNQTFNAQDCGACGSAAVALKIWTAPKAKPRPQTVFSRRDASAAVDGDTGSERRLHRKMSNR